MLYNLREYHRPTDLEEALRLLQREDVLTVPLAGGTGLVGEGAAELRAVVDLAALGLDFMEWEGETLRLGAMTTLQAVVENLPDAFDGLLARTAHRMAGWHIRNQATVGGTLAGGDIHAPFSAALAALEARIAISGAAEEEYPIWPALSPEMLEGQIITAVLVSQPEGALGTAYEQVGRTPADQPIMCAVAVTHAPGDGTIQARVVVGGLLSDALYTTDLMLDESNPDPGPLAAIGADLAEPALLSNYLGSAAYRKSVAPVLAGRTLVTALAKLGVSAE